MPKMKSNSGAKKRFKITGSGKVKRGQAFKRHLLESRSKDRKRNLTGSTLVHKSDEARVRRMLAAQN
jgi:large subunit ribosomal protein L35